MPYQRRGSLPLHPFPWKNYFVPSARGAGDPSRLARLSGLYRAAELRLNGWKSHRLRCRQESSDRSHAHRSVGNGGGRNPDQHPPSPRPAGRHALHSRWSLDSLPRAEAGGGAQEEVMAWLSLMLDVDAGAAEALSDAL